MLRIVREVTRLSYRLSDRLSIASAQARLAGDLKTSLVLHTGYELTLAFRRRLAFPLIDRMSSSAFDWHRSYLATPAINFQNGPLHDSDIPF